MFSTRRLTFMMILLGAFLFALLSVNQRIARKLQSTLEDIPAPVMRQSSPAPSPPPRRQTGRTVTIDPAADPLAPRVKEKAAAPVSTPKKNSQPPLPPTYELPLEKDTLIQ